MVNKRKSRHLQIGTTPSGLSTAPGQTLALIGGGIVLDGDILMAPLTCTGAHIADEENTNILVLDSAK